MTNPFALLYQPSSRRILARDRYGASAVKPYRRKSLIIKVVSTIGWLAGLTGVLVGCSSNQASDSPTPTSTVSAKSITSEEVENYARAVLAIEPSRQTAYSEIQKLTNDEPIPDVTCTKADTIAPLPKKIQDIAVNYCNQSKKIGESYDLTMPQFNAITVSAQSDSELQKRIQNELVRLQR